MKRIFLIAILASSIGNLFSQIKVNLDNSVTVGQGSYPWKLCEPYFTGDPVMYSADNWGVLGKSDAPLYKIFANYIFVNGVSVTSDERLKTNIIELHNCLNKIRSIKGISYDLEPMITQSTQKNDTSKLNDISQRRNEIKVENKNRIGFLAQDLKVNFPELVKKDTITGYYSVDYIGMVPILTNAINEQQTIIEQQDSIIKSQSNEILLIKISLNEVQKQLTKIKN